MRSGVWWEKLKEEAAWETYKQMGGQRRQRSVKKYDTSLRSRFIKPRTEQEPEFCEEENEALFSVRRGIAAPAEKYQLHESS